jgi:dimethylglycine dehydrogenase
MQSYAQAVVIGGGLIGCSIFYHLAKLGRSDTVLLECSQLTSGSTWHAAVNIHGLHYLTNISRLQHYTMGLYKDLEAESCQSCGIFQPGSLSLAQTEAREHQLWIQAAKAKRYAMNFYEMDRNEAERLHPLVNFDGIRCIMYEPEGGNVDPSGARKPLCGWRAADAPESEVLAIRSKHSCVHLSTTVMIRNLWPSVS